MKHDFLGRSGEKFPWVTEHLKKVVLFDLFFRIEFVFHVMYVNAMPVLGMTGN